MEKLFEEFIDFKSLSHSELSSATWKMPLSENMIMVQKNIESILCGTIFNDCDPW